MKRQRSNTIHIDTEKVRKLAARGLSRTQVALALGISRDTLYRHKAQNSAIEEAFEQGRAEGVGLVANALFEKAIKGNVVAQIFFLKCNGWKETEALEINDKNPVKIVIKNDLKD